MSKSQVLFTTLLSRGYCKYCQKSKYLCNINTVLYESYDSTIQHQTSVFSIFQLKKQQISLPSLLLGVSLVTAQGFDCFIR